MNDVILDFFLCEKEIGISFTVLKIGGDYLVAASGGDVPHIGALTVSSRNERHTLALIGHKENVITQLIQEKLQTVCGGNICVIGGIHVEHITAEQINQVVTMCQTGAERIAQTIMSASPAAVLLPDPPLPEYPGG